MTPAGQRAPPGDRQAGPPFESRRARDRLPPSIDLARMPLGTFLATNTVVGVGFPLIEFPDALFDASPSQPCAPGASVPLLTSRHIHRSPVMKTSPGKWACTRGVIRHRATRWSPLTSDGAMAASDARTHGNATSARWGKYSTPPAQCAPIPRPPRALWPFPPFPLNRRDAAQATEDRRQSRQRHENRTTDMAGRFQRNAVTSELQTQAVMVRRSIRVRWCTSMR